MANLGAADVDSRLEELLIDGIVYAFQEQTAEVSWPQTNLSCIIVGHYFYLLFLFRMLSC